MGARRNCPTIRAKREQQERQRKEAARRRKGPRHRPQSADNTTEE